MIRAALWVLLVASLALNVILGIEVHYVDSCKSQVVYQNRCVPPERVVLPHESKEST